MINKKEVIQAIETIRAYCQKASFERCQDDKCMLKDFCSGNKFFTLPESWDVPDGKEGEERETD